MTATRN